MDPTKGLSKDGVLAASEEASKAPTLFHPRERANYVREQVQQLRALRNMGKNDEEIKEALGSFVEQYPTLFQMAAEPHFDMTQLNVMLGLLNRMESGMSQHQASVIVGQKLANDFIHPAIGKK